MITLDETKEKYSEAQKRRFQNLEEREKLKIKITEFWKNNSKIKKVMCEKVSDKLTKYKIKQYTKDGKLIKIWNKVKDIINENPTYKPHNIYAVCSGEKPTMYGYVWQKCQI